MKPITDIRLAANSDELEEIFKFRYRIYVEEMNRKQLYADHQAKRIEDPLDVGAINLGAWQQQTLVGVVRINFPRDSNIGSYDNFYQMQSVGKDHPARTSIVTRLMVSAKLRNTRLALDLAAACYSFGLANGIRWNFIDCNDHLVSFFLGLGYAAHTPPAYHEEYGLVSPLRLELHNLDHLEQVGSPFAQILGGHESHMHSSHLPALSLR